MKKAPDPQAYWRTVADKLAAEQPALYLEIKEFVFASWDARSITHSRTLANRVALAVGNEYGYSTSTITGAVRRAIYKREREQRGIHNRRP